MKVKCLAVLTFAVVCFHSFSFSFSFSSFPSEGNDGRHLHRDLENILNELYEGLKFSDDDNQGPVNFSFESGSAKVNRAEARYWAQPEFFITFVANNGRRIHYNCVIATRIKRRIHRALARYYSYFKIQSCIVFEDGAWFDWVEIDAQDDLPRPSLLLDLEDEISVHFNGIDKFKK